MSSPKIYTKDLDLSFGVVGTGKFGSRVKDLIINNSDFSLLWSINSNIKNPNLKKPDWVYICSPNEKHFEQALYFIEKMKCNVIIEKPPSVSPEAVKNLIDAAETHQKKIYFSMVYLFDEEINSIKLTEKFVWHKSLKLNIKDGVFWALTYHDIYIYLFNNSNIDTEDIKIINTNYKSPDELYFELETQNGKCQFDYKRALDASDVRRINDSYISAGKPDTVIKMLDSISSKESLDLNKELALKTAKLMDKIRKSLFPRKLIVGGGIFGCSSAISLAKLGYSVDIAERNNDIMLEASSINQYRIHRGYHYPRSDETVEQCRLSFGRFEKEYEDAVLGPNNLTKSYYAIASEHSKVDSETYIKFLNRNELKYKEANIGLNNVSLTIEVDEKLFNPQYLKKILNQRINSLGINVLTNFNAQFNDFDSYDGGVVATYANQGYWDRADKIYQFELCEKPVAKLPSKYRGISVVIMDGPFMCIDPYADTDYHVMGNVVHAIHQTNHGSKPEIPTKYEQILNKGIVDPPKNLTNFNKFIDSAIKFFPDIDESVHIGSMYTIRAVEQKREHDDARLTSIEFIDDRLLKIFSGKVCTSISAAEKVSDLIKALDSND